MKVEVIGSGSIFSSQNSASYLVDDKILIDIPNGDCKALKRMKKDISTQTGQTVRMIRSSHSLITRLSRDLKRTVFFIPKILTWLCTKRSRKKG